MKLNKLSTLTYYILLNSFWNKLLKKENVSGIKLFKY